MKDILVEVILNYAKLICSIRDYIILSELLIISNYIFAWYVKNKEGKKLKHPLWILVFSGFIGIVVTRLFDEYILEVDLTCNKLSMAICYYQLLLITKNIGLIFGIDLTKYVTLKTKKSKNEND